MNFKKFLLDTLAIKFDKAFGLDIGDRSIEIIELEKIFRFSISTYGKTELPEGIVENGRIIDQNALAERLKKLLKEAKPKKVSTNKVIVSLPQSQVFIQCFEVDANLKSGDLFRTIIEKVVLLLPINIDKTYWDFVEKPLSDKTKKLIIFVSIPKDIANSYVKFCNSIGLEVVSLGIESLSLARVILKNISSHTLIMDIGSQATNLSFFDNNDKINMSISIPVAGDQMTEAIKTKLKIEKSEAESLKIKFGFKEIKTNKIREIILPIMEDILKETKDMIDYYERTFKQKLNNIYIVGGTALLPSITDVISDSLKKEVKIAVSGYNINLNTFGKNNYFPILANVIGLGMLGASSEFRDINLLKKMPSSELNSINKLNIFNMGYLSRINSFRILINNKYVLCVIIALIGIIFAILLQQAKNLNNSNTVIPKIISPVKNKIIPPTSTSTKTSSTTKLN